jgi:hypothetical protein
VFDEFSLEAIDEKFFCAISKFEERARKQIHFKRVTLTTQPSDGLKSHEKKLLHSIRILQSPNSNRRFSINS